MSETARKFFTLDEARCLIPYLSRQLKSIQGLKSEIARAVKAVEEKGLVLSDLFSGKALGETEQNYRAVLERLGDQINDVIFEIHDLGCLVKDIDKGLIDFYARIEGHEVFLCWRLGEQDIDHWHYTTEGFAQRRSLHERQILSSLTKLH